MPARHNNDSTQNSDSSNQLATTIERLSVAQEEIRVQADELIERQYALEIGRNRYHELFHLAPDAFLITDAEGSILEANRAAAELFEMDADRLLRKPLIVYIADPVRSSFRTRLNEIALGTHVTDWEISVKSRMGRLIEVSASTIDTTLSDDTVGILWSLRDVSERARLSAELERRVDQRTAALKAATEFNEELLEQERAARAEAERANRIKSDFFAVMSHEFRTPLQAIFGYVELLETEIDGPLTELQRRHIARVKANQTHLLGLVNRILDFARLDALGPADLALEVRPVCEMLSAIQNMIEPLAQARQISLEVHPIDPEVLAWADWSRVHQILLNLVSNAVKFTAAGGAITLVCKKEGDEVHMLVIDTGEGIPEGMEDAIFEPFVQVRSNNALATQGTGLGLAISRNLARAMGGDLRAASEDGKGSTFTLILRTEPLQIDEFTSSVDS